MLFSHNDAALAKISCLHPLFFIALSDNSSHFPITHNSEAHIDLLYDIFPFIIMIKLYRIINIIYDTNSF
jgi:hypothetical protein